MRTTERRGGARRSRLGVLGWVTVVPALATMGMVVTPGSADAGTPLAGAIVTVNQPPVDSLLSLCITSHTLDPKGTCLDVSAPPPAVTGTMQGVLAFGALSDAGVDLVFTGLGTPSLRTGFGGYPYFTDTVASVRTPGSFSYQASDGAGTCVTRQGSDTSAALAGVNYPRSLTDPVDSPSDVPITVPMWGQLECLGAFAGHTGPFNVDFAGTATFHSPTFDPCCRYADLQGGWAVVFGT